MRLSLALALATHALLTPAFAQHAPLAPHSGFEPPDAAAAASLAASSASVPSSWLTTGERTHWQQTGLYAEVLTFAARLQQHSPFVQSQTFGTTPQGRPMQCLVVSSDRAFTPESARRTGKLVILIQSGIHAGEIEGKDTALMLVRDMVIAKTRSRWLDHAIFLVIPVFNVDGHEARSPFNRPNQNGPQSTGTRGNALSLNLNRDYIRAQTPEMRAWLKLFNQWRPDFVFDNHVTDGADYQYDVTWGMAANQDLSAPVRTWVRSFLPEMQRRMESDGHLLSPYGSLEAAADGQREFLVDVFSPRYSHLYAAFQNRPALLVESHSLKNPQTRAWAHYDIMRHSIDIASERASDLRSAIRQADEGDASQAGTRDASPVYLGGKTGGPARPFVYHSLHSEQVPSPITGATIKRYTSQKEDVATTIRDGIEPTASAPMPLGFLIPIAWKETADLLTLHGIRFTRTPHSVEQDFDTFRFSQIRFSNAAFEGGLLAQYDLQPVRERIAVPAGSYYVPLAQPRARLIMALLHPSAPDALARYGFFNSVFQILGDLEAGEYLTEPIARRMALDEPQLWSQFQARLQSEPAFAADPKARLQWWTSQSSYQSSSANRYPILEVWEKLW